MTKRDTEMYKVQSQDLQDDTVEDTMAVTQVCNEDIKEKKKKRRYKKGKTMSAEKTFKGGSFLAISCVPTIHQRILPDSASENVKGAFPTAGKNSQKETNDV